MGRRDGGRNRDERLPRIAGVYSHVLEVTGNLAETIQLRLAENGAQMVNG